jgi:twinkle protein
MDNNNTNNSRLDSDSNFIGHEPCPSCESSDALARYDDGHGYCFSCSYHEQESGVASEKQPEVSKSLIDREYQAIPNRGLNEETCKKWDYGVTLHHGKPMQVATYRNDAGVPIAQKLRMPDKSFQILGNSKKMGLYGEHLWRSGGKMVTVTEGEIDALSVSQQTGNKWATVSVPNGAQGAHKAVARSLEWLETFESVVFMFDNDEAGRAAAEKCSLMLSVGKAKIATLPLKDANEMLVAGRGSEIVSAQWGAKPFRPDGVVLGEDLWEQVSEVDDSESFPYPWAGMNDKTYGIRKGELVTLTSGTGIGKSSICREIAHHLIINDKKVGYIALEESVARTAKGIMGISLNLPIHIHGTNVGMEQLHDAFQATMGTGNCVLYDHFGSMDSDHLLGKIRYMVKALDVEYVFLDHISIMVSGYEDGDERRRIDNIMTKLRSLVEEVGIALILVSHLKRPEGKAHEEGAKTSLAQLRGSASLGQLSDLVLGFERDQQAEDEADVTTVRVLKNRYSGETGVNCTLRYSKETGRLKETDSISHVAREQAMYAR